MANELSDEDVFGAAPAPKELSDADVFGGGEQPEKPQQQPTPPLMDFSPAAIAKARANLGIVPKSAMQVESEIAAAQADVPLIPPGLATNLIRISPPGLAASQAANLSDVLFGTKMAPIVEGATAGAGELTSGLTTPGSIGMAVGTAGAGKVGELALGGYFGLKAARELPEQYAKLKEITDPAERAKQATIMAGEVLAPASIFTHAGAEGGLKLSDTLFPKAKAAEPTVMPAAPLPKVPEEEVIPSAIKEGQQPQGNIPEHPGVPPGTNVPENVPEIRQGEGGQAGGGGGIEPSTPEEVKAPEKPTTIILADTNKHPVVELPVSELKLSEDVPNFKEQASSDTGVVPGQELAGKYNRLGTGAVTVWERTDGTKEVISGRHRLDLAKRTGEKTIPSQVVREADGFTKADAITFDAEANIRDGQGSVSDYANYFRNSDVTPEEASSRGLLARDKGRKGFAIGQYASDDLYSLYRAGKINESKAAAIADAGQGNADLQNVGIRASNSGASIEEVRGQIEAAQNAVTENPEAASQSDFFNNTTLADTWEAQGKYVAEQRKSLQDIISTRSAVVKKYGVATATGSIKAKLGKAAAELAAARTALARWKEWAKHPDLRRQVENLGKANTVAAQLTYEPAEEPKPEVEPEPGVHYFPPGPTAGIPKPEAGITEAQKAANAQVLAGIPEGASIAEQFRQDAAERAFMDQRRAAAAPKLLPGEKQGDLISSTQAEPFALAGEKTTEAPPPAPEAPSLAEQGQGEMFPRVGFVSPLQSVAGLGPVISRLNTLRKSFVTLFKARPTRAVISGTYDAIDNQARIAGQQAGNSARLEIAGTKLDRQAMTPIVEAQGDIARLKEAVDKVNASPKASPEMKQIYNYALRNFDRLEPKRAAIDNLHNRQLNDELANGINTDEVDGYVAHRYDMDLMTPGKPLVLDATGGRGGAAAFFKKQRVYPDYASAIADGYIPRTMDVADLVDHRIKAGQTLINQRQWVDALRSEVNPVDNKPVVTDLIKQPKGTFVPPPGYVTREPAPGVRVAVNEYFAPIVDALTGRSQVPAVAKNFAAGIKHGNLLLDTFHASRLAQMQLGLMGKVSYGKGISLLEYGDSDLATAVKNGEITQEMANYAKANRPAAQAMVRQGLNVGGISDALYKDVLESIPGMKLTKIPSYNKWLFDKLNRGVIMESALYMRERNASLHPDLSPTELDRMSAREANVYYRNLRSQGIFKSKTWQDAARIVFLAPQWVEGMVTSELKGYGQALKIPYDAATKGQFVVGNVAKGMGTGILAYMAATQLLNLLTRGKPTWENPEQGEKWSAFVPDFIQGGNGFFLNPFSVFGEMTHDIIKYGETTPNKVDVPVKIATNKLSAVSRAFRDVTIGKDFFGRPLDSAWDRAKQAGIDLAPVPITARGATAQYAGSQQRQLASSAGIKLDVAPSSGRQISELAQEFKTKAGIKTEPGQGAGDYRDLKRALSDGNMEAAHKEYNKLLQSKKPETISRYFDKIAEAPFTGKSKETEDKFRTSLDRQQLEIYNRARDDQSTMRTRFFQMTQTAPSRGRKPFTLPHRKK